VNPRKGLVLDANILLRAIFGIRVRQILDAYEDVTARTRALRRPKCIFQTSPNAEGWIRRSHCLFLDKKLACERIARRDPRDWPVVAVALLLNIPVWTEDQDFFGSGVPTWTTDRVEVYLRGHA
jgi:hypothetical protein